MGNKSSIAKSLVNFMLYQNPNIKYVYDLFGGGASMSYEFARRGLQVHYNDLNTGVCELLKKIQSDGVTDEFYKWVSREEFELCKNRDDWWGGFVKTCWSFGNNQSAYLYGTHIEELKKEATQYLFAKGYKGDKTQRINLIKQFKKEKFIEGRFDLQRLQRLQSLERLERLAQGHHNFTITNLSYEQVPFTTPIEETIIYLDPPYLNTAKYQEGVDHQALHQWILDCPYKVYVSSYEWEGLKEVFSVEKRSLLSAKGSGQVKQEKLFVNF